MKWSTFFLALFAPLGIIILFLINAAVNTTKTQDKAFGLAMYAIPTIISLAPFLYFLFYFIMRKENKKEANSFLVVGCLYLIPSVPIIYNFLEDWYYGYA